MSSPPGPSGPSADSAIRAQLGRFLSMVSARGPRSAVVIVTALLLPVVAVGLFSGGYQVPSDSVAVLQRFGRFHGTTPAGLHLKIPFGVDIATIVPVKRQLKQEFGFATPGATDPMQGAEPRDAMRESQMVTGDLNAALVEWVVQYRIADPQKYLFEVRRPGGTLRHVSESIMRGVVGDRTVDEVITIGRQEIEAEALVKMQALATRYEMGISIDQVQLKNINPPLPVKASFNEVNQAQQEKEKLINEARREYNKVVPLAEGEKDQRIREADGYRLKRYNEAAGDVAKFNALFEEYRRAPDVTRRRIYLETMQAVMPQVRGKVVVDEQARSVLPLLNLDASGTP